MREYKGRGYINKSMSVNAALAYSNVEAIELNEKMFNELLAAKVTLRTSKNGTKIATVHVTPDMLAYSMRVSTRTIGRLFKEHKNINAIFEIKKIEG